MSFVTKFAWSGAAVVLAVVLALGLMAPRAQAAAVAATGSFSDSVSAVAGSVEVGPFTLTEPSAAAWNAADTIALAHAGLTSAACAISGTTGVTNATPTYGANTTSLAVTAVTAGIDTVVVNCIRLTNVAGAAPTAITLTAGGTTIGTITTQRLVEGYAATTACNTTVITRVTQSVSADPAAAGGALCALVSDATGAAAPSLPVTFTVSQGVVSTGTAKTVTALTNAVGLAATNYRGAGNAVSTDTAIASNTSINAVSTIAINLTAPTGNTASKLVVNSPTTLAVGAQVTNVSPNYQSPTTGTNFSVQVQDSAGLGVNGQVVLVSTDKGAVAAGFGATCSGTTAKSITATSASLAPTVGGTVAAGVIQATYCANQLDAPGKATITAQNISTTMANATTSISMAGRPAKITAVATGNAITATVVDAGGNNVADGTPIRFTMSANAGAVSTACTTSTNGQASAVVSLIAATGTVIVSTDYNETGAAATCAAAGAQQLAASVSVPGGTSSSGGTTPPAGGAGSISSGSVPAGGGFGLIVASGDIKGVVTASGCPAASAAFWATVNGNFVTYVPGTSITAVNADFMTAFPGGILPAATPLIAKCK